MTRLYFEETDVGETRKAGPYLVSKNEIIQFAKQFDPVPSHIDEEAAARSIFGGLTACSAHTFSISILLDTRLQPRPHVLAGMGWDELRLPNAVRPGDELDLEVTVLEKRESRSKSDRGSFAAKSYYAIKRARRCCSASPIFSLRGDRTRKHRPKKLELRQNPTPGTYRKIRRFAAHGRRRRRGAASAEVVALRRTGI